MKLTDAQVALFEQQGFVVAEGIITDADLQPAIDAISDFIDERARKLKAEGEIDDLCADAPFETRYARLYAQSAKIGHGIDIMQMRAPAVFDFLRNDNLLDAIECLVGPEITCSPIQHLRAKVPRRLTGDQPDYYHNVPWHQDSGVTWPEADTTRIVTCWVPLVDATIERGCMEVLPGVASGGHLQHQAEGGTQIRPDLLPKVKPVAVECKKGGAVLMSQFTPHHSTPNLTEWDTRWSLDLRYQATGTPTGRPFHPNFVVRSPSAPATVLTDHAQWCRMWDEAFAEQQRNPQRAHRV